MSDFDVRDAIRAVTHHPCPTCHRGPDQSAALRAWIEQLRDAVRAETGLHRGHLQQRLQRWAEELTALLTATGEE